LGQQPAQSFKYPQAAHFEFQARFLAPKEL
jgi:hypothetical protein